MRKLKQKKARKSVTKRIIYSTVKTSVEPVVTTDSSISAKVATVKGGGDITVYKGPQDYQIESHRTGRSIRMSLGELEALAAIYSKFVVLGAR